MKNTNSLISITLFLVSTFSCSTEEALEIQSSNAKENNVATSVVQLDPNTELKSYHFIRFDIKRFYEAKLFIKAIRKLAQGHGGLLLTTGRPVPCLEGKCFKRNLALEFPNEASGEAFFADYQNNLTSMANAVAKNLSYAIVGEFTTLRFNEDVPKNAFVVAHGNILDLERFVNEYGRPTAAIVAEYNGDIMASSTTLADCRIGLCSPFNSLTKFESKEAAAKWYYSQEYQKFIPIREGLTEDVSLSLAVK